MSFHINQIHHLIFTIRDHRVMLDRDLAKLYGIETKRLNEQVRRNIERFPDDFMFQLTSSEFSFLKSQIAASNIGRGGKQKQPLVFTENGIAMLSSVLNSKQAIQVNIAIMRTFTKIRSFSVFEQKLTERMSRLELETTEVFKIVFEKLDELDTQLPAHQKDRIKIGIKT